MKIFHLSFLAISLPSDEQRLANAANQNPSLRGAESNNFQYNHDEAVTSIEKDSFKVEDMHPGERDIRRLQENDFDTYHATTVNGASMPDLSSSGTATSSNLDPPGAVQGPSDIADIDSLPACSVLRGADCEDAENCEWDKGFCVDAQTAKLLRVLPLKHEKPGGESKKEFPSL